MKMLITGWTHLFWPLSQLFCQLCNRLLVADH